MDFRSIASVLVLGSIAALLFPKRWKTAFLLGSGAGAATLLLQEGGLNELGVASPAATIETTDVQGVSLLREPGGVVRLVSEPKPNPLGRVQSLLALSEK